ncbi:MAG: DUF1501 domain-containing protein [Armatimonadetes bacterium]|nr:DUF1501 domain-containing protein [Armatimonadota bacterium]
MKHNINNPNFYCNGHGELKPAERSRFSRREALSLGLLGAGLLWANPRTALAQAAIRKGGTGHTLVVIFLRGGADGLNIVTPFAEDEYYKNRPSLAIANPKSGGLEKDRLIGLDDFFGMNPALASLRQAWDAGELAWVQAVGSQDQTHSHFEAMNTMERGLKNQADQSSGGWLARYLNATSDQNHPLRAVSFSSILPDSLMGSPAALAVNNISDFKLTSESEQFAATLEAMYSNATDQMARAGEETLQVLKSLEGVDPNSYKPNNGATYPVSQLGQGMKQVGMLIRRGLGLEVACLESLGWDSHVAQGTTEGWLTELLRDLGDSIGALHKDLGAEMKNVTVVVQTEFGRRVGENSGLGTDHGSASCMMVLGGGINGGKVYTEWPGLAPEQLADPGDLKVTTDYRSVLTEVMSSRIGFTDAQSLFPGFKPNSIGLA